MQTNKPTYNAHNGSSWEPRQEAKTFVDNSLRIQDPREYLQQCLDLWTVTTKRGPLQATVGPSRHLWTVTTGIALVDRHNHMRTLWTLYMHQDSYCAHFPFEECASKGPFGHFKRIQTFVDSYSATCPCVHGASQDDCEDLAISVGKSSTQTYRTHWIILYMLTNILFTSMPFCLDM